MTTSRRETILAAVATRTGAARAPFAILAITPPYTLLIDGQETVTGREYDDDLVSLSIGIHRAAFATDDSSHASDASALLAALISETLGSDPTIGGLCDTIRYDSGATDYPDDTRLVSATVTFLIDYRLLGGSPY